MPLETAPNLAAPDDFYPALIDAHAGLDEARSAALNAADHSCGVWCDLNVSLHGSPAPGACGLSK
jgi:hypothetical protein